MVRHDFWTSSSISNDDCFLACNLIVGKWLNCILISSNTKVLMAHYYRMYVNISLSILQHSLISEYHHILSLVCPPAFHFTQFYNHPLQHSFSVWSKPVFIWSKQVQSSLYSLVSLSVWSFYGWHAFLI
jgi:hypothetical protein